MLSLLLPRRCVHCEEPTTQSWLLKKSDYPLAHYLCINCARILEADMPPKAEEIQSKAKRISNLELRGAFAAFNFIDESPIQSILHSLKYDGMMRLGRVLGAMSFEHVATQCDYIVPVPLHRTRLAERGYNQAEVIAKGLSRFLKAEILNASKRVRPTPTQTRLSLPERIENVRGAFAVTRQAKRIRDNNVLVVDDVMTTGATIMSVCETIAEAQPKSISILALAAVSQ
jgi:competence protein ComFC